MLATQLRSNLDQPDWVLREIKENVINVVWGTKDAGDVSRLTNLIKQVGKTSRK